MTLVRRIVLALGIALATALVVAAFAIVDVGDRSHGIETIHRN